MKKILCSMLLLMSASVFAAAQDPVPFFNNGHMAPADTPREKPTPFILDNSAQPRPDFATVKSQIIAQQRERIQAMQTDLACVEAAVTPEALKSCQQAAFERLRKQAQASLNKAPQKTVPAQ